MIGLQEARRQVIEAQAAMLWDANDLRPMARIVGHEHALLIEVSGVSTDGTKAA
jgi:hypothetical protein